MDPDTQIQLLEPFLMLHGLLLALLYALPCVLHSAVALLYLFVRVVDFFDKILIFSSEVPALFADICDVLAHRYLEVWVRQRSVVEELEV